MLVGQKESWMSQVSPAAVNDNKEEDPELISPSRRYSGTNRASHRARDSGGIAKCLVSARRRPMARELTKPIVRGKGGLPVRFGAGGLPPDANKGLRDERHSTREQYCTYVAKSRA